jgi:hypothetical protein
LWLGAGRYRSLELAFSSCGSVQVATFNCQTVLPLSQARHQTVKPFQQQQLQANVTICPELNILQSDSYAEIGTDSLRTRPVDLVREFAVAANRGWPVQHGRGDEAGHDRQYPRLVGPFS